MKRPPYQLLRPFLVISTASFLCACGPHVERTTLSEDQAQAFVRASFSQVVPLPQGRARVTLVGALSCRNPAGRTIDDCILEPRAEVFSEDHHSTLTITVEAFGPAGIRARYFSRFDHRSFGKNQISEISGTVVIPWTKSATGISK